MGWSGRSRGRRGDIRGRRVLGRAQPTGLAVSAKARRQRTVAVDDRELLHAQPRRSDHDQRRGGARQAAGGARRARERARRGGKTRLHHEGGRGRREAHPDRRLDGEPRARLGILSSTRVLVGRHWAELLPRLRRYHGSPDARRSARVCIEVHRRQASCHWRGAVARDSPNAQADGSRVGGNGGRAMTIAIQLLLAASLSAAAPTASKLDTPANDTLLTAVTPPDTAVTTRFDVDGVTVILRRNTANE